MSFVPADDFRERFSFSNEAINEASWDLDEELRFAHVASESIDINYNKLNHILMIKAILINYKLVIMNSTGPNIHLNANSWHGGTQFFIQIQNFGRSTSQKKSQFLSKSGLGILLNIQAYIQGS